MPPRDPRLRPALERALPSGSPGRDPGYREDRSPYLFLFGDGGWHPVQARAWWRDKHGREVVQVEWSADGSTWGEAYVVNPAMMREEPG